MSAPLPRTTATLAVALLALGLPLLAAAPATALTAPAAPAVRSAPQASTVTVTGVGSATAAPDLALVSVGVEAVGKTAQAAQDAQSKAANALLAAVRKRGVAEHDVRTEGLSLTPVYKYQDGNSTLTGYQAAQNFSLKVRTVARTGEILQSVTDATGDAGRIHGVVFDVADRTQLRARAREAAHKDAHAKALQYARLSGRNLGRLVSLTEGASGGPSPVPAPADVAGGGAGVPIAPGEIQDDVRVTAVYELD
ncbi:SIMPL domain-containing protein [Streptomyces sp. P17]|uniref:SIMPL domain-containing protein n=1 Tax=Streptomyces sp. P17 TaxID=3074716 RepID=UPI0028F446A5|nr:SIMPL domain-containing protein [Streptomyces sp. P17]MDT9694921.1 SIMPL domain-containing protein [Streptomyces sp. P17]